MFNFLKKKGIEKWELSKEIKECSACCCLVYEDSAKRVRQQIDFYSPTNLYYCGRCCPNYDKITFSEENKISYFRDNIEVDEKGNIKKYGKN